MELKYQKHEVDFNLYVINKTLECIINYLPISDYYYSKIFELMDDLQNNIYSYPKEYSDLDITDIKYEITTYFEEFVPNDKSDKNANI